MSKTQLTLFKVIGLITPLFLTADLFRILPQENLLRIVGYIITPSIVGIILLIKRKKLDVTAKVIGWLNIAYVVYVVIMLIAISIVLTGF